ncbi:hypothetical protein VN97_g972 [Penicillium thymicola]|uniref:Complex 1 LYR protein domain-containing protein n=1 Tax=Penicillium thymicola TaxID=293382 RepID=A0AAI9TRR4_PENTH|nr:hypothetical protein VN97_g972 [Penicillium thymicola]
MARLSGLQRDVLSLYRKCLREIRNKPEDSRINFKKYARYRCNPAKMGYSAEFQKHISVNKKDFSTVEYLLRKGNRQLELYSSPGIRNIR